jgi:hypothetical protein
VTSSAVGRLTVALVVALALAVVALLPDRRWALGFAAGLGVFVVAALILMEVGARMLRVDAAGEARRPSAWLVPALLAGKLVLLGGGSYVALVPFALPPVAFVSGALATLALVTVAAMIARRRAAAPRTSSHV